MSASRMNTSSIRPPKYPETSPTAIPSRPEITTAANPTISAGRAPKMILARMSRPRWSVPRRWARPAASCEPGGLNRFVISCSIGSYAASHGAPSAATTTAMTTTRPKSAVRRRARRRANTAHSRRAGLRPAARSRVRALIGTLIVAMSGRPAQTESGLRKARPGSVGAGAVRPARSEGGLGEKRPGSDVARAGGSAVGTAVSSQSDPRVEVGVEQVHDQVDEHERGREEKDRRLHHRVVAVVDRLNRQAADARPGEDRLGDDRAAEQRAKLDPDDGHDRDRGVLERVLPNDRRTAHAFGPRRADVVLAQHLEHARPRQPRDAGGREEPEGDRRQDEVLERAPPRGGQEVELHREHEDQHDPQPEGRHRLPQQGDDRRDVVDHGVAPHGRDDAGGDRQAERHQQGGTRELERYRPPPQGPI